MLEAFKARLDDLLSLPSAYAGPPRADENLAEGIDVDAVTDGGRFCRLFYRNKEVDRGFGLLDVWDS